MEPPADFFTSYKAVSNKLKKRFLKKPNLAEARDEFNNLAKSLEQNGCFHYAGFCCLAMARCEQNMTNSPGEIQALVKAARYFLEADQTFETTNCQNVGEHLNCAKNCFDLAIKSEIAGDSPMMAGSLCEEIAAYLAKHERYDEAIQHYHQAAELYFQNLLLHSKAQKRIMELKITLGEHYDALLLGAEILEQIVEKGAYKDGGSCLVGSYAELHCECEVSVVLLLMLIDPHPLKTKKEFSQVLQKYTWSGNKEGERRANHMNDELFILLQSFVMSCASKDVASLEYVQSKLRLFLTTQQMSLVDHIIDEYKHPSGLGY